jgi:hypothetical protein
MQFIIQRRRVERGSKKIIKLRYLAGIMEQQSSFVDTFHALLTALVVRPRTEGEGTEKRNFFCDVNTSSVFFFFNQQFTGNDRAHEFSPSLSNSPQY